MSTHENHGQPDGTWASITASPGARLTAVLAVIYGVGVAFGPQLWDNETFWSGWLAVGAAVVGLSFVWHMVIPLLRGRR